jgi:hypothetical protein
MRDPRVLQEFLAGAYVDAAVFPLRPGYRHILAITRRLAAPHHSNEGN